MSDASGQQSESDQNEPMRLSKAMSLKGLCSRREADEYIRKGWVRVDGEIVDQLGAKILLHQSVELSRPAQQAQSASVTILLNKPVGYVSNLPEKGYPPAVSLILPETEWQPDPAVSFQKKHLKNIAPAGRLDIDSRGLIVFTQDGRIAKLLTAEASPIEKEYYVSIDGPVSRENLGLLREGLELDGKPLRPANVKRVGGDRLNFILREGRKRQIRRMCQLVGLRVLSLCRVRIGKIELAGLPEGRWRYLKPGESFVEGP